MRKGRKDGEKKLLKERQSSVSKEYGFMKI